VEKYYERLGKVLRSCTTYFRH